LSLIFGALGALLAVGTLLFALVKRMKPLWLLVVLALGAAGVLVFFLTGDLGGEMVVANIWAAVSAAILAAEAIGITLAFKS